MNRSNIIALLSLVIGLSLVGVIFFEWFEIENLRAKCDQLEETYDQLVKYFFIKDSNFTISLVENPHWKVEAWHENLDSISEIRDGTLHLFYNETSGDWYGNSGVFQGIHTDGRHTNHSLWIGRTPEEANFSEHVIFLKSMLSGKFWLEAKFRIVRIGFNRYPSVFDTTHARVNLGLTLMCAIDDKAFNLEAQTLWLDIYLAGYSLKENDIEVIPKDSNYAQYNEDIHAGYFVGEVHPSDFGEWVEMSIDLGDYISRTLNFIAEIDIKTVRVYGFILFVECLGAYAEVEYDCMETIRT